MNIKTIFQPLLKKGFQKISEVIETYILASEKGAVNGVATLDSNMKLTASQLPDSVLGQLKWQGLWNAGTNTPTLPGTPTGAMVAHFYIVSAAGTFAGHSFQVGDWIVEAGGSWWKVDNTDAVSSVFGRTGNIIPDGSDYAAFYASLSAANTFSQKVNAPQFQSTTPTGTPPFIVTSQTQVPNLFASFSGLIKSIVYANGNPQRDARDRLATAGFYNIYATNTSTNFPENTFSGIKFQFADGVDTVGDFIMGKGDSTLSNFYFRYVQSVASGIGTWSGWLTIWNAGNSNDLTKDWRARILFAAEKVDALRGVFGSSVKVGYDSDVASATNVGAIRYNNSVTPGIVEMVLKNSAGNYSWQKLLYSGISELITNLNADKVDGYDFDQSLIKSASPEFVNLKLTNLSVGFIPFINSTGFANSGLFWDAANGRIGINTQTPGTLLDVVGVIQSGGSRKIKLGDSIGAVSIQNDSGGAGWANTFRFLDPLGNVLGGLYAYGSSKEILEHITIGTAYTDTKFKIDFTTGNVAINIATATEKLHIGGNAIIEGTIKEGTLLLSEKYASLALENSFTAINNFIAGSLNLLNSGFKLNFATGSLSADRIITFPNASGTIALTSATALTSLASIANTTSTINVQIAYGATLSGNTKTVNIGRNGVAGSITNVNIGSTSGGESNINLDGTINANGLFVAESSVKIGDDTRAASASIVGSIRYREASGVGYIEQVMQTSIGVYAWVKIKPTITVSATEPTTPQDGDFWIVP